MRDDWLVAWPALRWLTLRAGLGLGALLDTGAGDRHQLEVGLPLTAAFGDLEIVYRPIVSIPLSRQSQAVYGGELSRGAALAFIPFEVQLCWRWRGLAW